MLIHQSLVQPSSEEHPPAAYGSKQGDHSQTYRESRDLRALSHNWVVSTESLPSGLREFLRRGGRIYEPESMEETMKIKPLPIKVTSDHKNSQRLRLPA